MTGGELGRRHVVECAVRPYLIVIAEPSGDENTRLGEAGEPLVVEAFIAEAAVEAFDEGVLGRLARLDELQAPVLERPVRIGYLTGAGRNWLAEFFGARPSVPCKSAKQACEILAKAAVKQPGLAPFILSKETSHA